MLSGTLRGTIATFAVPLALSAAVGSEHRSASWRTKPGVTDVRTGTATNDSDLIVLSSVHRLASADTSEKAFSADHANIPNASSVLDSRHADSLDVDWIVGSLAQVMELQRTPKRDLPNETLITIQAVANAARVILDLQESKAPAPQIVARGDGGLHLVWYTPSRDLEIEVAPDGSLEIVEFDGTLSHRGRYSVDDAIASVSRIRGALDQVSLPA